MNLLSNIRIKLVRNNTGGLLGFASFDYRGELYCSGVAVHKSEDGDYYVKYPCKKINSNVYYYFNPRREMTEQIREEIITEFMKVQSRNDREGSWSTFQDTI